MRISLLALFFVGLTGLCLAQPLVRITEIAPQRLETQDEWFEFSVQPETPQDIIDMQDWQIRKGTRVRTFRDYAEALHTGQGVEPAGLASGSGFTLASETPLIFTSQDTAWFWWDPSPVSLTNSGAMLEILDSSGTILDTITYNNTKAGTKESVAYAEVWNRHATKIATLFPLIARANTDPLYQPTPGAKNAAPPSFPEDIELLISEVSPKRDASSGPDFIELFVRSSQEAPANLKYLRIKHNGTTLFTIEQDFWVKEGDFIILEIAEEGPHQITANTNPHRIKSSARDGLSAGSGSVELILYDGTSFAHTEDVLCWMDESLSQTEQNRVSGWQSTGDWQGDCFDIRDIIPNESLARNTSWTDRNRNDDFFRHFHGSLGTENKTQNNAPTATITIQGSGKLSGPAPFSLNVTGEASSDPDGDFDLQSFLWKLDDEVFSPRENPVSQKIEQTGVFRLTLTVTDTAGLEDTAEILITVYEAGGSSTSPHQGGGVTLSQLKKALQAVPSSQQKTTDSLANDTFFDAFLSSLSPEQLILFSGPATPPVPPSQKMTSSRRPPPSPKNLGFILLETY